MEHEHTWLLTETGYVRTWTTKIDEEAKTIRTYWGGSEDYGDTGAGDDHLACYCGATRSIEGFEVEYE